MAFEPILPDGRVAELTKRHLWQNRLVSDVLDDAAAAYPDRVAVVDANSQTGRSTTLSYRQLHRLSVRFAAGLAALGVERDDVVAVQLPNWWHYAALYTACVRIGAVINPLMPIFRHHELEYMLGYAAAKAVIVPRTFRGFDYPAMIEDLRPGLPRLETLLVVDGVAPETSFESKLVQRRWEDEVDTVELFAERRPGPNDVTEIMYTSGTTGQPKGVMHTANTLLCKAKLASELFQLTPRDVVFMGSPLAHQTGFMYGCILSIYNGTKCVLQDVWDPIRAAQLIQDEHCTLTLGSTPFLRDLVYTPEAQRYDTSSLRVFLCAGAPIPRVLVRAAAEAYPNLHVMSAWGMTENGIVTATYRGDPPEKIFETDGRALPHQEVRVVDEAGEPVANGIEGRLQARCATAFVGYLGRPQDYGMSADMWFETGDNARMDADGSIRITGRSKDIIIRGGENVPVVTVEELLYRHPAVADVAVVAMPDERLGERGCAFVQLRAGHHLDFAEMVRHLERHRLTRNYMPERLELVQEFPRTPSGKIQKFKLREMADSLRSMQLDRTAGHERIR